MPQWASLAIAVAVAMAVSASCTLWAIRHARRHRLLDLPGERRSHQAPTPRGGGVGIVVACVAMLLCVAGTSGAAASWLLVTAGTGLVAAIGWWDDHRPLPILPRLLVHGAAGACLAGALAVQGASLPTLIAAFALAIVLTNAWNFMDGIDGLAASQALLCGFGYAAILGGGWRLLALVLAAACLGFLPFNAPRARVFLGDVGSGTLGYLVAALLAAGLAARPGATWPLLMLPPMAMLADAGLTLLWRMRRGERWWEPHVQHAYQRWSRTRGHAAVAGAYLVWTFASVAIMLAALHWSSRPAWGVALAGLLASALAWQWLHQRYAKNNTEGFGT